VAQEELGATFRNENSYGSAASMVVIWDGFER